MTKASIDLQDLRRRIYVKAKAETSWKFWGLCEPGTERASAGRGGKMAVPNSEAVQWLPSGSTSAESRSGRIGPIILEAKQTGERSARKSACCVRRGGGWKRGMVEMV